MSRLLMRYKTNNVFINMEKCNRYKVHESYTVVNFESGTNFIANFDKSVFYSRLYIYDSLLFCYVFLFDSIIMG